MTEVHYDAGSPCLGFYDPRNDRIVIHEGLLGHPQVLKEILEHELAHVEIMKNGRIPLMRYMRNHFLDYRRLWQIYRNQELLDLHRKISGEIGFRYGGTIGLIPYLIPKICLFINWVEGLR